MLGHHGGNLDAARRLFPGAPEPWIDLSTGINPFSYPVGVLPLEAWTRLPEPAAVAHLERIAAAAYRVPPGLEVVAAPGTQNLIQWLPRVLPGRRVGILGPTYGEYAQAWADVGVPVTILERSEELPGFDVAVVCNPNNPDGRIVQTAELLGQGARSPRERGKGLRRFVVVDEAFVDFSPGLSIVPHLPADGVIVLRSFGKTYGLGGLRLGFAIAPADMAARLRAALGPWAVSGPAVSIGRRALADTAWLAATCERLRVAAQRVDRLLMASGATIVGGTVLFRLADRPDASALFERLGQAGVLVRRFGYAPTWLRFGIPADEAAWTRLAAALR